MSKSDEITIEKDDSIPQDPHREHHEDGIDVPLDKINPDTLKNLIAEFVTREWSELGDSGISLESKVEQVLAQLRNGQAKVVFDLASETCNIVPCR